MHLTSFTWLLLGNVTSRNVEISRIPNQLAYRNTQGMNPGMFKKLFVSCIK